MLGISVASLRVFLLCLTRLPLLQRQRRLVLPVHSLVCLAAFSLALPLAISLFPQMSKVGDPKKTSASAKKDVFALTGHELIKHIQSK